jgi:uncharacterized delta-60 repeat protein
MRRSAFCSIVVSVALVATPVAAAPGALDHSFSGDGLLTAFPKGAAATGLALDGRGRTVVVGYSLDQAVDVVAARFLRDGTPDPAFGISGRVRIDVGGTDYAFAVAIDADDGIAIAGTRATSDGDNGFVVRLDRRGVPSRAFGGGDGVTIVGFGKRFQGLTSVAFTPKGRLIVGGYAANGGTSAIARLRADGRYDGGFAGNGRLTLDLSPGAEQVNDVLVLDDGAVVAAGYAEVNLLPRFALFRVLGRGALDTAFGLRGGVTLTDLGPGADVANAITRQSDGKLAVAGRAGNGGLVDWGIARYGARGRPDPTFDGDGVLVLPFTAAVEEATDIVAWGTRLVVVGRIRGQTDDVGVVRLRSGGGRDLTFGASGVVTLDVAGRADVARGVAVRNDGRIVVAGSALRPDGVTRIAVARLLGG